MLFEAPEVLLKICFVMSPVQNFGAEGRQVHTGSPRAALFPHGIFPSKISRVEFWDYFKSNAQSMAIPVLTKPLGKTGRKAFYNTIWVEGENKPWSTINPRLSERSNAPTQSSAVGEGRAALTLCGLNYRLAHEVSQICSPEEAGRRRGLAVLQVCVTVLFLLLPSSTLALTSLPAFHVLFCGSNDKWAFSCTELWKLHLSVMQCSKDTCNITLEMTGPWRQGFFPKIHPFFLP